MAYIGKKFELMAQKTTTDKELKEKELSEKKKNIPFMQVDKYSDPISNFITNFKRQFKETKGLVGKLFAGKRAESQKTTPESVSIIGSTKTVMRSDFKNTGKNQTVQTNKKPVLKIHNPIKIQQSRPKNKI